MTASGTEAPRTPLARDIVTPITLVLFAVSTVTGLMLLVHWNGGLVRFSHEWLSVVFSAIALWHLVRNWKAFTKYVRRRAAWVAFMVCLAGSVVITGMTGSTATVSPGAVFHTVSAASLSAAAPAFGLSLNEAQALLSHAGITAAPDETLAAIGARSGLSGPGIMTLLATGGQSGGGQSGGH